MLCYYCVKFIVMEINYLKVVQVAGNKFCCTQNAIVSCIVSWPLYRYMYRIVGKCIVAALLEIEKSGFDSCWGFRLFLCPNCDKLNIPSFLRIVHNLGKCLPVVNSGF